MLIFPINVGLHAGVAELADALDLGSSAARRVGSTPSTRTTLEPERGFGWQAELYKRTNRK